MSENFTNSDELIQLLDEELAGEQLKGLRDKISSDTNLAAALERLRLTREAVKTYGLQQNITALHAEMMQQLNQPAAVRVTSIRKTWQYGLRIAALLLLFAGSVLLYQYFAATPEKLFRNNFETWQLSEMRGHAASSALETAYKNNRMPGVIQAFKQLPNPQPQDYFLNGNAALRLNNAPAAIASFQQLQQINIRNNTHFFEEDTEYFLGLAYLSNHQPALALPLLQKIHADKLHPFHGKISAWFMQKLRRLAK